MNRARHSDGGGLDRVGRALLGHILARLESAGRGVPASRCAPARELMEHYPSTPEWLATGDAETLEEYRKRGRNPAANWARRPRAADNLMARLGGSRRAGR